MQRAEKILPVKPLGLGGDYPRMRALITSIRNKVLVIAEAGNWPALSAEAYGLAGLRGDTRDPCQLVVKI